MSYYTRCLATAHYKNGEGKWGQKTEWLNAHVEAKKFLDEFVKDHDVKTASITIMYYDRDDCNKRNDLEWYNYQDGKYKLTKRYENL